MRRIAGYGYVALVAALAVTGAVLENPWPTLVAAALTLPSGLGALAGIYGGYAFLDGVGGVFTATTLPNGDTAPWLLTTSAILNVVLLTTAAGTNILLFRHLTHRHAVTGHPQ